MNKQTTLLALIGLITGFSMWIISGLWHNLILANFYRDEVNASHEGIGILLMAYLILGTFMMYFYHRGFRHGGQLINGVKLGILVGILWVFPHELAMTGAHGESFDYVLKNGLWHAIEQGLGGLILGALIMATKPYKNTNDLRGARNS